MARRSRVIESSSDSEGDRASSEAESDDSSLNQLIDLEAVESAESSDESSTLGDDDDDNDPKPEFTKFQDLPPELRRHIWELFCPDLVSRARVLNFEMAWHALDARDFKAHWRFSDGMALADGTEALRKVSAVHQESRQIVLDHSPDTLRMHAGSGDAEVRFHKDRDIVYFHNLSRIEPLYGPYDDGFCNHVRHAAFTLTPTQSGTTLEQTEQIKQFLRAMPNLNTVFLCSSHNQLRKQKVRWCGSRMMQYFRAETYEKEHGLGEDLEWMYCWPDPQKRWDETTRQVLDNFPTDLSPVLTEFLELHQVRLAPMVCFESESGQALFNRLVQKHDLGKFSLDGDDEDEESSSESGEEEEEPDEYESDGIDDAEILSQYSSSEDELVPNPISPGGSPDPGNFSSAEEEDGIVARFSSLERDDSDNEVGDMEPAVRVPKRRIVSDSEDEDDEPSTKRVRTQPAAMDDSSDEDDEPSLKLSPARPAFVDGSSDEDEGPRGASQRSRAGRGAQVISSDSESGGETDDAKSNSESDVSQSESEDEEENDEPPARLSLAERLALHRVNNPVGLSDDDDSQEGSEEEDSLNDEDGDEEDDESGDGLLDDMAEQSESEGEGESEEGW